MVTVATGDEGVDGLTSDGTDGGTSEEDDAQEILAAVSDDEGYLDAAIVFTFVYTV